MNENYGFKHIYHSIIIHDSTSKICFAFEKKKLFCTFMMVDAQCGERKAIKDQNCKVSSSFISCLLNLHFFNGINYDYNIKE